MKKYILALIILCCTFIYSCTPPPDDIEPKNYNADYASLVQGYGPAVKEGVAKSPNVEFDFQPPEQQVLTIDGKTYVAEYSTQLLGKLEYRYYSNQSNPSITYSLFADTGKFASISLFGGTIDYNKIFEEHKTEEEYLDWIRSLLAEYGIDDLDEYTYTCETLYTSGYYSNSFSTPDNLDGYQFNFVRYVNGMKTDDTASVSIYKNSFSLVVSPGKFKDFYNATIDILQCDAVAESFMMDSLESGWSFTDIKFDGCILKSNGDLIYLEYSYLVELRDSEGRETASAYVINVYLE